MISHKTRAPLTITIGTIIVTIGTILLVAFASGYNIDVFKGEVYTTGLVLLNTNPSGSSIKINSKLITQKTPHRLENVATGTISVDYFKPNYHSWHAKYFVRAGQVSFADYALLIADNITVNKSESNIILTNIMSSPDSQKVFGFINSPGSLYEIMPNSELRSITTLPLNPTQKPTSKLEKPIISMDGSVIISSATYDDSGPVTFWTKTGSGETRNIDELWGNVVGSIKINPSNNNELFGLELGQIKKLNIASKESKTLAISNITSYSIDSNYIFTLENLTPVENGQFLVRYDHNGNNRYVLSSFGPTTVAWTLTATRINNQIMLSLLNPTSGGLYVFREQDGKNLISFIGEGITNPVFSPNGRFISFSQSDKLKTIDIDYTDRYSAPGSGAIAWLGAYHIIISRPDGLHIIDFNGFNEIKLPPNTASSDSYISALRSSTKSIYYLHNGKLHNYTLENNKDLIRLR